MSYRKSHVKNRIQRIKPKKSIFKNIWLWIFVLLVAFILAGLYGVFFYSGFQVKSILVSGNGKVNEQDLQTFISDKVNTGLVNFWTIKITSRSMFLVNLDRLNKDVLEKFPIIEKINLNKQYPQTLSLGIIERKPIGIYCSVGQQCFLIDENGVAFEKVIPESLNINYTIVRQMAENGHIFTGEKVVTQNIVDAISKIQKNLQERLQLNVSEAFVTNPLRLNVKTSENWQIYFDLDPKSDIAGQLVKLDALLNGGITETSRGNLLYIDLRPADRAIVCDNKICAQ